MSARIINGKKVSEAILKDAADEMKKLSECGIRPTLAVFRAGDDFGSLSYEKSIRNEFKKMGIAAESFVFPASMSEASFISVIRSSNDNPNINGILVFEPLPEGYDRDNVRAAISPEKDIDGVNPLNSEKLMNGDRSVFCPCAAEAVAKLLKSEEIELKDKRITIVNDSALLGKPLSVILSREASSLTVCNKNTENLGQYTKDSDIVISGCGEYGTITPEMLKEGCTVIDIGIAVLDDGWDTERTGDCSRECIDSDVSIISATKGLGNGTGPITTAVLVKHVINACKAQNKIAD